MMPCSFFLCTSCILYFAWILKFEKNVRKTEIQKTGRLLNKFISGAFGFHYVNFTHRVLTENTP